MRHRIALAVCICVLASGLQAHAQLSSLLREGFEAMAKGSARTAAKATGEAVEFAAPKVSSLLSRNIIPEAAEGAAKVASKSVSRHIVSAIAKHGEEVCLPVVAQFGDDGARALAAVSKDSAVKLAKLVPDLAKNPRSSEWISRVITSGDDFVSWLWERRLSIAVGTAATAVMMQPKEFLEAGQQVATTALTVAGEHIIEPIIGETASHVVDPLMREISRPLVHQVLPAAAMISMLVLAIFLGRLCWLHRPPTKS